MVGCFSTFDRKYSAVIAAIAKRSIATNKSRQVKKSVIKKFHIAVCVSAVIVIWFCTYVIVNRKVYSYSWRIFATSPIGITSSTLFAEDHFCGLDSRDCILIYRGERVCENVLNILSRILHTIVSFFLLSSQFLAQTNGKLWRARWWRRRSGEISILNIEIFNSWFKMTIIL